MSNCHNLTPFNEMQLEFTTKQQPQTKQAVYCMKKFKIMLLIFIIVSVCGCAKTFEKNSRYATPMEGQYLERDKKFCNAIAEGVTPTAEMIPIPQPYTITTTGQGVASVNTYSQRGGYGHGTGNYTYRQTTNVNNDAAAFNAGMQNFGAGLGRMLRKNKNFNECMGILGWTTQKDFTYEHEAAQKNNNIIYEKIRTLQQDPLYNDVIAYMSGKFNALPAGEKEIILRRISTDIDAFEKAYYDAKPQVEQIIAQQNK